jgi:hypothetical protein
MDIVYLLWIYDRWLRYYYLYNDSSTLNVKLNNVSNIKINTLNMSFICDTAV